MASGGLGVLSFFMAWALLYKTCDVECSWAWEWDRDNYSPIDRHSRIPHVGVRRSIFDRFWGETTPNNPFLPTRPSASRVIPRLNENDFNIVDDYDEIGRNPHWFPQTHALQQPKSLEGIQQILEGKLGPINNPSSSSGQRQSAHPPPPQKEEKEKKQKTKQRKYRQRLNQESGSPAEVRPTSHSTEGEGVHPFPDFGTVGGSLVHDAHLANEEQHLSKDSSRDFQETSSSSLSMPERLTNNQPFPKDFIVPEEFSQDFGLPHPLPNDQLTTDPFVHGVEGQESFPEHILLSPLPNHDFQSPDQLLNLHPDQALSQVDLPQIFPNLGLLGNIDQPETFMHQDRLGHFGLPNAPSPQEAGDSIPWLPPALNLPSPDQMFASLEQQKLSKEADRGTRMRIIRSTMSDPDACHARHLHSCGSRLIDEFAFGPDNPDKCRIREEFLDCMEQVMKLPCELHGERYSREGTKVIRDKIKTLLWSAQGCILGYST